MYWLDRKIHKENLKMWDILGHNYITFNISDTREIEDIERCFRCRGQNDYLIGIARLNYEATNSKFELLESLVDDLGGQSKFINFYNALNNLGEHRNVYNVNLQVGTNSKAKIINYSDIEQNFQMKSMSVSELIEENINVFLNEFIKDLNEFGGDVSFLFLIEFHEGDKEDLKNFRYWIKDKFVKKLIGNSNIKIVILYTGKSDAMLKSDKHIDIDETIDYAEICEMTKSYEKNYGINPLVNDEALATIMSYIIPSDGKVNNNITYAAAARIFHTKFKLNSDNEQICLMKK